MFYAIAGDFSIGIYYFLSQLYVKSLIHEPMLFKREIYVRETSHTTVTHTITSTIASSHKLFIRIKNKNIVTHQLVVISLCLLKLTSPNLMTSNKFYITK